ncbi:MAG: nucleotide sugar dehydrogenase, partial [Acidimicrobiales bacterium]|nr:nucleotide sugar dehydrogenase [Acidimicrobiales bacterium]
MGYVGIPCAALLADVPGFRVTGVQRRSARSGWKIDCLNRGDCPFDGDEPGLPELLHRVAVEKRSFSVTDDPAVCRDADVILIDVQTPTDGDHVPHYESLREVSAQVGRAMRPGALVIIESTVAPGTTQHLVQPILERESGLAAGVPSDSDFSLPPSHFSLPTSHFSLAFSYERVMPGKLLEYITDFPRVVGGVDAESTRRAVELYSHIVRKEITPADVLTAEMAKVVENAYRDVNIAFANEVALLCERMGVDVYRVRQLINARPDRHMHLPGAGVGGHCLPKDSWLLKYGVETYGRNGDRRQATRPSSIDNPQSPIHLIPLARAINDAMPVHMAGLIEDALHEKGVALAGARVALLGASYLEDADDTRNTPAAALARELLARDAQVVVHDPYVRPDDWARALGEDVTLSAAPLSAAPLSAPLTTDLDAALRGADCAALVTRHRDYLDLTPASVDGRMRTPAFV